MYQTYPNVDTEQPSHELMTLRNTRRTKNNEDDSLDASALHEAERMRFVTSNSARQSPDQASSRALVKSVFARPSVVFNNWKRRSQFHGWQWGVLSGACIGTFVLLMNCAFIVVGAFVGSGYQQGIATLFSGSATTVSRASILFHILINTLSTLLLSASNYAMQVLSSPTYSECKKAHQNRDWLDIGILSLRNLKSISRRRRTLWLILCLSSIPLHLFYNASIFQVLTNNQYQVQIIESLSPEWQSLNNASIWNNVTGISKLTISDLQSAYGQESVSEYGDVSLTITNVRFESSMATYDANYNGSIRFPSFQMPIAPDDSLLRNWIASVDGQGWVPATRVREDWQSRAYPFSNVSVNLDSGFARPGAQNSKIQLSLPFLLIVVVCNATKVACFIFMVAKGHRDEELPMVTLGDAVSAFLESPDEHSRDYCIYSKTEYFWATGRIKRTRAREEDGRAAEMDKRCEGYWEKRRNYYGSAISERKRVSISTAGLALSFTLLMLFTIGRFQLGGWGTASTSRLSIGQLNFDGNSTSLLAFIANSPQILLSMIYLYFNSMFTAMALAIEWDRLGTERKGLRVTKSRGEQRETYFLQLPLKWGIPVNGLSGLLHWLASQTLFLVRLDSYYEGEFFPSDSVAACGFSSSALLALVALLLVLFVLVSVLGLLKFDAHVPFAGTCSWVISAACHPDSNEAEPWVEKVQWGVISEKNGEGEALGHCSFSARPVDTPNVGMKYE